MVPPDGSLYHPRKKRDLLKVLLFRGGHPRRRKFFQRVRTVSRPQYWSVESKNEEGSGTVVLCRDPPTTVCSREQRMDVRSRILGSESPGGERWGTPSCVSGSLTSVTEHSPSGLCPCVRIREYERGKRGK